MAGRNPGAGARIKRSKPPPAGPLRGDADALDIEAFIHALHTLSESDVLVLGLALEELRNR